MGLADIVGVKEGLGARARPQEQTSFSVGAQVQIQSRPGCPLILDPEQKAACEYFGVLRTRLLSARSKGGVRSVLITSPQEQDGKSFISLNLAVSLAQLHQERVLLIDGDLRLNGITRILDLQRSTGIADFLRRSHSFANCVRPTTLPHLYIAPAGNVLGDSLPGILEGPRWPEFLQNAKQQFDLILVDSVPVSAPIADFELLLSACDTALLVVHVRKTTREALDFSAQQMHDKLLGVIVNKIEPRADLNYQSNHNAKKRG